MSSQSIPELNQRLYAVRAERSQLLHQGIDSLATGCPLVAERNRNRARVLSAVEFNLINQRAKLLEQMADDDPADYWKKE